MRSFGRTMRGAASALGLGLMATTGLVAVSLAVTPAAFAQKQQKPPQQTKAFIAAYQAAQAASTASNWPEVIKQTDIMIAEGKDNSAKAAAYQMRLRAFAQQNDKANLITSIEGLLGTGLLDVNTAKPLKENLAGLYSESGNDAKAEELTRAYIAEYGGTPNQHAWLAQRALNAQKYDEAIASAQKAIDTAKAANQKPVDRWYNIKLNASVQAKNWDSYYSTLDDAVLTYPSETYLRPMIERATRDPGFTAQAMRLDLHRAFVAAKIKLKPEEQFANAEAAAQRGMPIEAEKILQDAVAGGATLSEGAKKLQASVATAAKADRDGGLAGSEKEAATAANGNLYVTTGEGLLGLGDYAKAADLIQKGLAKGGLKPGDEALAKLHLGIAQFKAGQKDAAVATWQSVKSDNGAESLAKSWIAISKLPA